MTKVGWLDCSAGAAGDMLLAAALDAGAPAERVSAAVDALGLPVGWRAEHVTTAGGLRGLRVVVASGETDPPRRTWADVRAVVEAATLPDGVRVRALSAFRRLAEAEARVHGGDPEDVHFHEVGAADAIVDVVGTVAAFDALGLAAVHVSPVALGGGSARGAHGTLPVPVPAVLELFAGTGAPVVGGPADAERCTPTGAALLTTLATSWGPLPQMTVARVGVGAGSRQSGDRPNVVRLVVGDRAEAAAGGPGQHGGEVGEVLLEANVDDLDPRLWPGVLARLIDAGASDAWLVPILMKKGRPAHTLCVLVAADRVDQARRTVFTETSTIGLRETPVAKRALERRVSTVRVGGHPVRVKVATLAGDVVTATPEFDDVVAAARAGGWPVKAVLAQAVAAAQGAGLAP